MVIVYIFKGGSMAGVTRVIVSLQLGMKDPEGIWMIWHAFERIHYDSSIQVVISTTEARQPRAGELIWTDSSGCLACSRCKPEGHRMRRASMSRPCCRSSSFEV